MKNIVLSLLLYTCVALQLSGECPLVFPSVEGASVGISIVRLSDRRVVAEHDIDRLMTPASVLKCLTAATAQLSLPEDFTFSTGLKLHGDVDGSGTFKGMITVVGGYDPTLDSRFFPEREPFAAWAVKRLRDSGIRRVVGGMGDFPEEVPEDAVSRYWLLEDVDWEYGAGCYPVNYCDNSYVESIGRLADRCPASTLCFKLTLRMEAEGIQFVPEVGVESPETEAMDVSSDTPAGLSDALSWKYLSPERDDILKVMMHRSDNLYAESMLRAPMIHARGGAESLEIRGDSALVMQRELWSARGIDLGRGRVVDGSGLAPVNKLSARMLADVLCSMAKSPQYVGLFPLAGRDGTVRNFLRSTPLAERMAVKSGSMTGVLCYAGYVLDKAGKPTHVAVVMVNNFTCQTSQVKSAIATYLSRLLK